MSVEQSFKRWLMRGVLMPFALLLILLNTLFWLYLGASGGAPQRNLLLLSAALGVSLAALLLFRVRAWRSAKGMFVGPFNEALAAGRWALRTLLGRNLAEGELATEFDESEVPAVAELEAWERRTMEEAGSYTADQQAEMRQDLELAMEFQQAFLNRPYPKVPAVHAQGRLRLEFYHSYKPALALGGDFFDILTYGPDCAGVLIADVMGHGTRSALITAVIRTLIRDLAAQGRNAPHFISGLNRSMIDLLRVLPHPIFASAFYFVADTTGRVATFSSAGHPAPFHIRRSKGRIGRLKLDSEQGAALGLLEGEEYPGGTCRLIAGDMFLFFTDGVYEAMNRHGEEFGLARMEQAIQRVLYRPAHVVVDSIIKDVETFLGTEPLPDDICIVAVEVTTEEAGSKQKG
jgi:serine phosphatase RsbU (regulator of sigma subunit)